MDSKRVITLSAFALLLSSCATPQRCIPPRDAAGHIARSRTTVADFKREHPCPATGKPSGACPGYIVDHIQPLCACGADSPTNMQWQSVRDAKAKDRIERETCAAL